MKILLINDKYRCGGAEIYCDNLRNILSKDNDIYSLHFDNDFSDDLENVYNLPISGSYNKLIFNPIIYFKIRKILKKISPDIVLLNNSFASPITQLKALKGFKVIQIVHDYSIVCPKSTCIHDDLSVCGGYRCSSCFHCCTYHGNRFNLILKLYLTKRMEKLRKKIISKFVSPSECLCNYLLKYGYNAITINNPVQINNINNKFEKLGKIKKYLYVGVINERKGIFKFIEHFLKFSEDKNVILEIIGKPMDNESNDTFNKYLSKSDKIKYLGFMGNADVLSKIAQSDFLVVPSLWMENYPTTVIEGMISKTLVIGSNRGGIPEMMSDDGFVFDILDRNSVLSVLDKTQNITIADYNKIVDTAYNNVVSNNSFSVYKDKIINVIKGVLDDENINS